MPAAVSRACAGIGEDTVATSTTTRATKRGQRSGSSTRTEAALSAGSAPSVTPSSGFVHGTPVAADTSRAIPIIESSSGRFASISRSRTASSKPKVAFTSAPTGTASRRIRIPE